jgi:hypothetical protein
VADIFGLSKGAESTHGLLSTIAMLAETKLIATSPRTDAIFSGASIKQKWQQLQM